MAMIIITVNLLLLKGGHQKHRTEVATARKRLLKKLLLLRMIR